MKNGLLLRKKNVCLRHYMNKEEGQVSVSSVKRSLHQVIKVIKKNLNIINGEEEEGEQFLEVKKGDNNVIMVEKEQVEEYRLSLNALADSQAHNTIRIGGNC